MPKIYSSLKGGLGNQLFQYAAARALCLKTDSTLVLDTWSGFVRDTQYRRHYELDALPIRAHAAMPLQRLPIWLYRVRQRFGATANGMIQRRWYGQFLVEIDRSYLTEIDQVIIDRTTWLVGYWQSPRYFSEFADTISTELMPPAPQESRFLEMGQRLRQTESVALGIRLYEESTNPGAHARDGHIKTVAEIRTAITRMQTECPNARFFIFCTHRSPLLEQLQLPEDSVYLTHDDDYEGTIERLWLLSQCRHHIFTNSSYYWWGAWLSAAVRVADPQLVIAADNFTNRDVLCPQWETF